MSLAGFNNQLSMGGVWGEWHDRFNASRSATGYLPRRNVLGMVASRT
jgi:hypothetical protein